MDHEIDFLSKLKLIKIIISVQSQFSQSDVLIKRKRISSSFFFIVSRYDRISF